MDISGDKFDTKDEFYTKKHSVILKSRDKINHDTYMFRFDFQDANQQLGMMVTQHFLLYGQNLKGEIVTRKYTAVVDEKGYFLVPIKIYRPMTHPKYPEGGELTPWLESIELNTVLMIKRCIGKLLYNDRKFILRPKSNTIPQQFKTVLICVGGTGITPAYQLIQSICNNPEDETRLIMLYANRTEVDILMRQEIEALAAKCPHKFKLHYTLDTPPEGWNQFAGFVTLDMFKQVYGPVDQSVLGVLCGPKPMNKLVIDLYSQLGLSKEQILKF